jgi:hypothetical protein
MYGIGPSKGRFIQNELILEFPTKSMLSGIGAGAVFDKETRLKLGFHL